MVICAEIYIYIYINYIYIDQRHKGHGQYDDQWVCWGMSIASEMFLIFTTQLFSRLCVYNSILFIH